MLSISINFQLILADTWCKNKEKSKDSTKVLSLYQDEHTRFTLLIRGSIEFYLPTARNVELIPLINYSGASEKRLNKKTDFIIRFPVLFS